MTTCEIKERSKFAFRFLDEATGLYWTGSLKAGSGPKMFNHLGVEYRHERAADQVWTSYEAKRRIMPELPELVRVRYEVVYNEIAKDTFQTNDKAMIEAVFDLEAGYHSHTAIFVRQILHRHDWSDFLYIIVRLNGGPKGIEFVKSMDGAEVSSKNKTKNRMIAVRSDADLVFAKMNLGNDFKHAYDFKTGQKIQ